MNNEEVLDLLERVKNLQEEILSCKDDRRAIILQQEMVDLLKDIFKDKELLNQISKLKK